MALIKLNKVNYLGEGYFHEFKENTTGQIVYIQCTKDEYISLGIKEGHVNNPTLDGHTWICSGGGSIKVDTKDGLLSDGEYCQMKDRYIVGKFIPSKGGVREFEFKLGEIVDDQVEEELFNKKIWL